MSCWVRCEQKNPRYFLRGLPADFIFTGHKGEVVAHSIEQSAGVLGLDFGRQFGTSTTHHKLSHHLVRDEVGHLGPLAPGHQVAYPLSLVIEPGALEGMIQYWVRKGRLKDDRQPAARQRCAPPAVAAVAVRVPKAVSL